MTGARRNPDPRSRALERAVASGDESAIEPLLHERLRSGVVKIEELKRAEYFSRPIKWSDLQHKWWRDEQPSYTQRLSFLNTALVALLKSRKTRKWAPRGGAVNAPPSPNEAYASFNSGLGLHYLFHVMWVDSPDTESEELAQRRLMASWVAAGGEGYSSDAVAWWDLRERSLLHEPAALNLLAHLRRYSPEEYLSVMGGSDPDQRDARSSTFRVALEREARLVQSFLGGPPL